jgi:two-component system, NtrC family, response regulator
METPHQITEVENIIEFMVANGMEDQAIEMEQKQRALIKAGKAIGKLGSVTTEKWLKQFITQDPDMLTLKDQVRKLVEEDDPVLVLGESGTGKELLAKALHGSRGPMKDSPSIGRFVAVNCTSFTTDLLASELFGHVKGSFTGAHEDRIGKLQYAYRGTLFLDEIGDMPLNMQAMLLRVLQEKTIIRVGDNKEVEVDFRLVCATHRDIPKMISEGLFREDLYYRISTFELRTKPLRERVGDIILIAKALDPKNKLFPYTKLKHWNTQGNVRGLQQWVRRQLVLGI